MVLKEGTKSRTSQEAKKFFLVLSGLLVSCGLLVGIPLASALKAQTFTGINILASVSAFLFIFAGMACYFISDHFCEKLEPGHAFEKRWTALRIFSLCAIPIAAGAFATIASMPDSNNVDAVQSYYAEQHHLDKSDVNVTKHEARLLKPLGMKDACKQDNTSCYMVVNAKDKTLHNVLVHTSPGKVESMREFG